MRSKSEMHGRRARLAVLVGAVAAVAILLPTLPAGAFSKTWIDAGCTVNGTSHGLLDGMNIGGRGKAGSFWMNPVSSANESCAYVAGAHHGMASSGQLRVRVKIDPRVKFTVAVYGTQGDITCAKPLVSIVDSLNDEAFHLLTIPLPQGEWVDCVRMVLDDDPNVTPPGQYPYALIDYIKMRDGLNTFWAENFS